MHVCKHEHTGLLRGTGPAPRRPARETASSRLPASGPGRRSALSPVSITSLGKTRRPPMREGQHRHDQEAEEASSNLEKGAGQPLASLMPASPSQIHSPPAVHTPTGQTGKLRLRGGARVSQSRSGTAAGSRVLPHTAARAARAPTHPRLPAPQGDPHRRSQQTPPRSRLSLATPVFQMVPSRGPHRRAAGINTELL